MNHHVMHVYSVCFSWPSGPKSHPQATTSRHVQHKWKDWKPSSPCQSACAGQALEPGSWSAAVPRQFESSASELEDWPPAKAGQSQPICKWVRLYTVVNPFIFCCLWLLYIYICIYIISISVCVLNLNICPRSPRPRRKRGEETVISWTFARDIEVTLRQFARRNCWQDPPTLKRVWLSAIWTPLLVARGIEDHWVGAS